MLKAAVARILSFIPNAAAALLASRFIIAHFGIPAFNGFTIAESLIVLLPLNDLGVGSAITSAFASGDPLGPEAEGVTLAAGRAVALSALGMSFLSLFLAAGSLWQTLLGKASYGDWFFGLAMVFFAAGFLPGLAQGMLLGVHRNHVTVLVQTLITPFALVGVLLLIAVNGDGRWVVTLPAAALALVNFILAGFATRATKFSWRNLLRKLPWRRRYPGGSIRGIAGPRFILSLAVPLALQNDRIVLSHVAAPKDVAAYGVVIQIFAPITALVAAAAAPLWPIYIASKAKGSSGPRVVLTTLLFFGPTTAICAVLVALSGPIGQLVGDGKVHLGLMLPFAAAAMTVLSSAAFPVAMYLTSPKELRFVAIINVIGLPANIALSIVLARAMGAPGPLFATTAVVFGQLLAAGYYIRTRGSASVSSQTGQSSQTEEPSGDVALDTLGQERQPGDAQPEGEQGAVPALEVRGVGKDQREGEKRQTSSDADVVGEQVDGSGP